MEDAGQPQLQTPPPPKSKRKVILWSMSLFFLAIALGLFFYWMTWGRFHEYTNDAYVSGNLVYVTPQVSGIVTSIYIDDTQLVEEGHLLIELDKTDFLIQIEKDKAELADTIRNVAEIFLQTKQALALLEVSKQHLDQTSEDFERRMELIESGSISQEDLEHAKHALISAYFSLESQKAHYLSLLAQTDQTTVETHPRVLKSIEKLKTSWLEYKRSSLKAPAKGLIAQRSVQVGQRIHAGEPLLAIVPLDQIWVDANFKEVQIGKMQIGQKVSLSSDVYGSSIEYHGRIGGIGGGTGSVFSVLPPQNATGNWIKIVQRVPVRIYLNPREVLQYPLRPGLSMQATVNIHDIGEPSIPHPVKTKSLYETHIFEGEESGIEPIIKEIFDANYKETDLSLKEFEAPCK